jgi:hypothetical protein
MFSVGSKVAQRERKENTIFDYLAASPDNRKKGMQDKRLQACVESICSKGCHSVRRDMEQLQQGGELEETQGLSVCEKRLVLKELEAIMSVYGDSCPVPDPLQK